MAAFLLVALLSVAGLLTTSLPAAAHTDLLQASPGPGQRAGGTIKFIDLVFLEPVSEATVEVIHNGESLPGKMNVTDGSIIRFELDEPLDGRGEHQVVYRMVSFDLDDTEASFSFTFEEEAPQAQRIGDPVGTNSGRNWVAIIATAVLVVSIAGLAFMFLSRVESKRRLADSGSQVADSDAETER